MTSKESLASLYLACCRVTTRSQARGLLESLKHLRYDRGTDAEESSSDL